MKRGDHNVAVACENGQPRNVVAGDRTAGVTVRKHNHRITGRGVRKYRRIRSDLHVWHDLAVRQRIVGTGVVVRSWIAREHHERDIIPGKRPVEIRVLRSGHRGDQRIPRVRQQIGRITRRAAARRRAFPIARRVLAGSQSTEILDDVAARNRKGTRQRPRLHDFGRRQGARRIAAAATAATSGECECDPRHSRQQRCRPQRSPQESVHDGISATATPSSKLPVMQFVKFRNVI